MPRHDGASEYRKVAQHRLHDARELLEEDPTFEVRFGNPATRHLRGAMYLAGYAVECVLKAFIVAQAQARTLTEVDEGLTRTTGHNLDELIVKAGLDEALGDRVRDWRLCRTWTPDWRYDPSIPSRGEAVNFVNAAERIHNWVRAMI